jgi:hypothetical protein
MGALKSPRCSKGHKLSGDNLYLRHDGQRQCKKCALARSRATTASKRKLGETKSV